LLQLFFQALLTLLRLQHRDAGVPDPQLKALIILKLLPALSHNQFPVETMQVPLLHGFFQAESAMQAVNFEPHEQGRINTTSS
jgi:hypothetical protein